ncbi:Mov34/MPN/PAD-1 family protein [Tritonibacter scottomollicae]|uniref:Mov34/MPN/PAD-1 family protein n=1 Tax=Tritonibacter scottomollicae TaxID=483013 RepID=UPI003AA8899D
MAKDDALPTPQRAILVASEVIERISTDAARYAGRSERGGIFIGLRRGPHIEIKEATLPMRWDLGSMFAFRRSAHGHQDVALSRWRASAHTMDWVGEWHSHPQSVPTPSHIDLASWRDITNDRNAPMVFLIVGHAAVWLGVSYPGASTPIKYVEAERSGMGIAFLPE